MKKIFLIILISGLVVANSVWAEEKIINMVTTEFCPYVCIPETEGGKEGFVIDIFRTIFEQHGYTSEFEIQPWIRALNTFNHNAGRFDGIIPATKIHPIDRDIAIYPEIEICLYTHKFYVLKDSPLIGKWKYDGIESLGNIRLGCIRGWSYSSQAITEYVNKIPPHQNVYAMHGEDVIRRNINLLLKKRTEMYVENEFMVRYFLYKEKKAGNKDMEKIVLIDRVPIDPGVGNSYPVFYKTRKGKRFADMFADGMKALRASGRLSDIMEQYGLKDWR